MHNIFAPAIAADPHLKNGFYIFENKIYLSKIEALIDATKKQSDIQYYYNEHVYDFVNWSQEPSQSLVSLYRQQAQLIRDSYDYVIVMYSGGSDSTTVLDSFLSNNIKPDEIWSMVAYTNTCGKTDLPNIEITNAAWPVLEQAQKSGVPVHLVNQVDFDDPLDDDWWLDSTGIRLTHDTMMRKKLFLDNPKIKKLVDQGKKVTFVFGYDKPRLLLENQTWCVGVLDTFWSHHWKSQHQHTNGPFFEFFFYSAEIPEILSKSCHILINYFEKGWSRQQCLNFFNSQNPKIGPKNIAYYRRQVNINLYHHCWDELNTFSLGKSQGRFNQFNDQKCSFVVDHYNHWHNYQAWLSGINAAQSSIDQKFYDPGKQITGHWSKIYPIRVLKD